MNQSGLFCHFSKIMIVILQKLSTRTIQNILFNFYKGINSLRKAADLFNQLNQLFIF